MNYFKYPRTFHLPWSLGSTQDDKTLPNTKCFEGLEVVVSEKLDGECTSLYTDHIHARSTDTKHHLSRNWIKSFHGEIKHNIPEGFRICGENVYALHSIYYQNLLTYFYVFAIYNDQNICLSFDETVEYVDMLGLTLAPVLYRGIWNEDAVRACWTEKSTASPGDIQEGYVVRIINSFSYIRGHEEFSTFCAKFVRKNHVQTDEHWMSKPVVPNSLRK